MKTNTTTKSPRVLLVEGWYSPAFQKGVAKYAGEAGWILDASVERFHHRNLSSWRGDGAILLPSARPPRWIAKSGTPCVAIGHKNAAGIPRVGFDNLAIGRMAAQHFIERGFENFAFYRCGDGIGERERRAGFEEAVRQAGGTLHHLGARPGEAKPPRKTSAEAWLGLQLKGLPMPLAVAAELDDRAIEVLDACLLAGLQTPEQVAILGVDNDELRCPFATVPLSSVETDMAGVGFAAAKLLGLLMDGGKAPDEAILIPPKEVVVRLSTDMLAIDRVEVANALRFIWDHYKDGIRANDVAEIAGLSRQRLHQLFLAYVGRSVAEEIDRRRLEAAKALLKNTKIKGYEIAKLSGFSGATHFCRSFKRSCGATPMRF